MRFYRMFPSLDVLSIFTFHHQLIIPVHHIISIFSYNSISTTIPNNNPPLPLSPTFDLAHLHKNLPNNRPHPPPRRPSHPNPSNGPRRLQLHPPSPNPKTRRSHPRNRRNLHLSPPPKLLWILLVGHRRTDGVGKYVVFGRVCDCALEVF